MTGEAVGSEVVGEAYREDKGVTVTKGKPRGKERLRMGRVAAASQNFVKVLDKVTRF